MMTIETKSWFDPRFLNTEFLLWLVVENGKMLVENKFGLVGGVRFVWSLYEGVRVCVSPQL